jgi:hypothetical protein
MAYTQGSWNGHLTNDPEEVEPLRIAFDSLRDAALVPAESLAFLRTLLDECSAADGDGAEGRCP